MKPYVISAALLALAHAAPAALSFTPFYSGSAYHTHSNADSVTGFAWGPDGKTYYATSTPSFNSGGLHRKDGAASTQLVAGSGSLFSGSGVVAIGSKIHYNDSDFSNQYIRTYDTGSSTVTTTSVANYALATDGTNLFTTGSSDFTTTRILYYGNGNLSSSVDIGGILGSSGPIALDSAGNLFYAPGFGDKSIYRWSFAEVAAAIAGGPQLSASGHLFADYSVAYASMSGATSMAVDASGNLYVTLTNFIDPSSLVKFDATGSANELVATSTDLLGGLAIHEGGLYVANGNQIFNVVPEPSSPLLFAFAIAGAAARRRRAISAGFAK